jgi:hypothetical protein
MDVTGHRILVFLILGRKTPISTEQEFDGYPELIRALLPVPGLETVLGHPVRGSTAGVNILLRRNGSGD